MKKVLLCCVLCSVMVCMQANAFAATRDLVFEDDPVEEDSAVEVQEDKVASEEPEMQAVVKVNATVELTRDGETSDVLPSAIFKSGDRIKIKYMTNVDAYAYWLSEGSSGDFFMLFPNKKTGRDNLVKKNVEYMIPSTGTFKFDDTKGVEQLLLTLCPEPVPELEDIADDYIVKGGSAKLDDEARADVEEVTKVHEKKSTTRDLVFEDDEDEETQVVTKSQTTDDIKQPFVIFWELVHE